MAVKASVLGPATLAAYRTAAWMGHRLAPGQVDRRAALARWRTWAASRPAASPLWIHAASVGEALTAVPVCRRLRARRPDVAIVLSYTSPAAHRWPTPWPVDRADYLPPDQPGYVGALLDAVRPRLLGYSRADVWPELTAAAVCRDVPVALLGATVRPGSGRLSWPVRRLFRSLYHCVAYAGATSRPNAARLAALGVRPGVLEVTGDPRHDQVLERIPDSTVFRQLGEWAAGGELLVAGSTDHRDEATLLDAYQVVRADRPLARLLVCPHRPSQQRSRAITALADQRGMATAVWRGDSLRSDVGIVIVEPLGALADLYALGSVAYVGGGLSRGDLHAVIEPAAYAVPVIVGPRGHHADAALLVAAGGAAALPQERPVQALAHVWLTWLKDATARGRAGLAARGALSAGAARQTTERLLLLLS